MCGNIKGKNYNTKQATAGTKHHLHIKCSVSLIYIAEQGTA
jgi:hypothetical protein